MLRPSARLASALLALAVCLSVGCGRRTVMDAPWVFDAAGPVGIDVEMFAGDVEVTADPDAEQVTVRLQRESTHGYDRKAEALRSFDDIGYSVEMVGGGASGRTLQVRSETMNEEPHLQRTNVSIEVPAARGVRVRTTRGAVRVEEASGPIDIRTTRNDVRVITSHPLTEPVTILNTYGNIDLRFRPETAGEIDAEAVNGRVFHKMRRGRLIVHPGTSDDTLRATLNDGTTPLVLRTVEGDIRVLVDADPGAIGHYLIP